MQTQQVFTPSTSIHLERHLPVSPGRLFFALTDSAEVSIWMRFPATIGNGLGGRIYVQFGKSDALDGVISVWAPDRAFGYTWADSIVNFTISTDGTGEPDLLFTQTGVDPDLAAGLAAGWHAFLDNLQQHLTGTERATMDADLLTHYKQVYNAFHKS